MVLAALLTLAVDPALACPEGTPMETIATDVAAAAPAASHTATAPSLVGTSCSYSTALMARRVLDLGEPWQAETTLAPVAEALDSNVAAPFLVDGGYRVVATELVQVLTDGGHATDHLVLAGKWLEVDGVRYVVLTSFKVVNS
jgi:hypothetical protein